jgi:DNA-nicking Smr family endonuclease
VKKKKESNQEDKKTWEDYIKNPSDIYDKDKNFSKTQRRDRYKFDLHGFTLDEANIKVKEILQHCIKNRFRELLLITGKGMHSKNEEDAYVSKDLGKLKYSVPEFIKTNTDLNKLIISISDAKMKDGGEGAIIIKLKDL